MDEESWRRLQRWEPGFSSCCLLLYGAHRRRSSAGTCDQLLTPLLASARCR
jgi:hypothetical protein